MKRCGGFAVSTSSAFRRSAARDRFEDGNRLTGITQVSLEAARESIHSSEKRKPHAATCQTAHVLVTARTPIP